MMIGEAAAMVRVGAAPAGVRIRQTRETADFARIAELESEVWGEDWSRLADELARGAAADPEGFLVFVAEAAGQVVAAAWLSVMPGTEFGGLWGGSTLPAWRGRGVYRALVAERTRDASALGVRYLQLDASDASRPILERLGFVAVTTTTPYLWRPGV